MTRLVYSKPTVSPQVLKIENHTPHPHIAFSVLAYIYILAIYLDL
jgi:hypothetical protein